MIVFVFVEVIFLEQLFFVHFVVMLNEENNGDDVDNDDDDVGKDGQVRILSWIIVVLMLAPEVVVSAKIIVIVDVNNDKINIKINILGRKLFVLQ